MKHVLIADDHEVTRRGIRDVVAEAFEGVEVSEAADGPAVVGLLPTQPWDLILLDVSMPNTNILELVGQVRSAHPEVPVLVLTALLELEYVIQTMKAGANGLIHKHRASDELVDAIKRVAGGGSYLHPETAAAIASSVRGDQKPEVHQHLSERELQTFLLIAKGRAVKEVALDLGLSDKTVATYLARIREKTGLTSHVEIARYALQRGLVD